jgi:hypothetical protein
LRGKYFGKFISQLEKREDGELSELSTVMSYTTYIMPLKWWRLSNWGGSGGWIPNQSKQDIVP